MAANITIGSLALDATGKILTGTLAGGTGTGYAPASGVTGLVVKATVSSLANAYALASATISGTTITITTYAPIPSAASAVTLDVVAGNLVDDGANTATLVAGTAVTNGSSAATPTAFAISNAAVLIFGDWSDLSLGGRNARNYPYDTRVKLIGTHAYAVFYAAAPTSCSVSVDGGAPSTVTIPTVASSFVIVPLFSGLSDAAHEVRIIYGFGYTDKDGFFRVVGSAPAIAQPTIFGTPYVLRAAAVSPHVNITGDWSNWTLPPGGSYGGSQGASVRFKSNAPSLYVYALQATTGTKFRLIVDGVDSGSTVSTTGTNSTYDLTLLGSGLDTGSQHDYELVLVGATGLQYAYAILADGAGTLDMTATITARTVKAVYYGDSIIAGSVFTDLKDNFSYKTSRQRNAIANYIVNGVGGTSVEGTGTAGQARTGQITSIAGVTEVHVQYGTNDLDADVTDGSFKTAFKAMLTAIRTGLATPRIFVYKLLPETNFAAKNTAIQAAISEVADGNTVFVEAVAGIVLATHTSDNRHPNATGTGIITNNVLPYLDGSGVTTITGPSGGTSGVASTAFTAALRQTGATFNGLGTVTLTASDGTITATAAGGSISGNGTGTVIVTPAAAATAFTFTYTPASAGAKTITPTNGQGWTDPAAAAYTAVESRVSNMFLF